VGDYAGGFGGGDKTGQKNLPKKISGTLEKAK
jgi:hypothetical protein